MPCEMWGVMPQSVHSGGSASGAQRYVQVILLNKEVLSVSVEVRLTTTLSLAGLQ